jgi:hypothetical protein
MKENKWTEIISLVGVAFIILGVLWWHYHVITAVTTFVE